jgi:hypothetical protein
MNHRRPWPSASPLDARFTKLGADFAAAIHGVPKEDLLSQEVRQQRQALRLAASAAAALAILLGISAWLGTVAETQKSETQAQRDRAEQALVSATDTILELAKAYRNAETTPGAMTDITVKIRNLQKQLSADVDLGTGMQLTQATVLDETAETLLVWGLSTEAVHAATEARALLHRLALAAPDNLEYQHALEMGDNGSEKCCVRPAISSRHSTPIAKHSASGGPWPPRTQVTHNGSAIYS